MKEEDKICILCANAFISDDDELVCALKNYIVVEDEDTCEEWN